MSITIYWASLNDEWMRATSPEPILKRFYKDYDISSKEKTSLKAINYCPVFNERIKNLYAIKSIYDYNFKVDVEKNTCTTDLYDQNFFNSHVGIRSLEDKFFSFFNQYIFFTDQKSLEMSAYEHPVFEENEITKRCIIIPGMYDIGKWFRPLEFAFILKKDFNEFKVNYQDVLYYLRFHTKENIIFKQFKMTQSLNEMSKSSMHVAGNHYKRFGSIEEFYNIFKLKNKVLEEIKNNLL
jgi:hypothetical protein